MLASWGILRRSSTERRHGIYASVRAAIGVAAVGGDGICLHGTSATSGVGWRRKSSLQSCFSSGCHRLVLGTGKRRSPAIATILCLTRVIDHPLACAVMLGIASGAPQSPHGPGLVQGLGGGHDLVRKTVDFWGESLKDAMADGSDDEVTKRRRELEQRGRAPCASAACMLASRLAPERGGLARATASGYGAVGV